jgi:hypothetical protein
MKCVSVYKYIDDDGDATEVERYSDGVCVISTSCTDGGMLPVDEQRKLAATLDPEAGKSIAAWREWCDELVIGVPPGTNEEMRVFVSDRLRQQDADLRSALAVSERKRAALAGELQDRADEGARHAFARSTPAPVEPREDRSQLPDGFYWNKSGGRVEVVMQGTAATEEEAAARFWVRLYPLTATAREEGRRKGRAEERAAVVMWLRGGEHLLPATAGIFADDIESGEHISPSPKAAPPEHPIAAIARQARENPEDAAAFVDAVQRSLHPEIAAAPLGAEPPSVDAWRRLVTTAKRLGVADPEALDAPVLLARVLDIVDAPPPSAPQVETPVPGSKEIDLREASSALLVLAERVGQEHRDATEVEVARALGRAVTPETPDDRERAIVRRLAGEWGEIDVGPTESIDDVVSHIHGAGTMLMRMVNEVGDWSYWAREHLGSKEHRDAKLREALGKRLAAPSAPHGGPAGPWPTPSVCECCEGNPAVLTRYDATDGGGPLHLCDACHDDRRAAYGLGPTAAPQGEAVGPPEGWTECEPVDDEIIRLCCTAQRSRIVTVDAKRHVAVLAVGSESPGHWAPAAVVSYALAEAGRREPHQGSGTLQCDACDEPIGAVGYLQDGPRAYHLERCKKPGGAERSGAGAAEPCGDECDGMRCEKPREHSGEHEGANTDGSGIAEQWVRPAIEPTPTPPGGHAQPPCEGCGQPGHRCTIPARGTPENGGPST